jgi:predicted nucleic acid-binding protein
LRLLDTDILIDIQRCHPPAVGWFESLGDLPALPGFVAMELIQDARDARELRESRQLVAPFDLVWPTEGDCGIALGFFAAYHLSHGLGLLDALIAGCAVGRAATLCTFNEKHYRVIPGLDLERPYSR